MLWGDRLSISTGGITTWGSVYSGVPVLRGGRLSISTGGIAT